MKRLRLAQLSRQPRWLGPGRGSGTLNLVGMNDIEGGDRRDPNFLPVGDGGVGPWAQERKAQAGERGAGGAWNPAHAQRGPLSWETVSAGSTAPRTGTGGGSAARSVTPARLSPRNLNRRTAEGALSVPRQDWGDFLGTPGRGKLPAETSGPGVAEPLELVVL